MKAPTAPLLRFLARTTPATCRQCAPKVYIKRLSTSAPLRAKAGKPSGVKKVKPLPYSPPRKPLPSQSPTSTSPPPPPPNPLRHRTLPLLLGSLTAFALAGYSSYIYVTYRRATSSPTPSSVPLDVSERYNDIATEFDGDVEWMEWSMGLLKLRREMATKARGRVCEVSVGTGRNMGYYSFGPLMTGDVGEKGKGKKGEEEEEGGQVTSFTAVDKSPQMIAVAREKFSREHPGVRGVQWVVQDASLPLPPPPSSSSPATSTSSTTTSPTSSPTSEQKYDTILQTMGLCSTPHPSALLLNLASHLAPGGRILLLEHGRGYWGWLNNILDALAPGHAERFGCWWNREVGGILEAVERGVGEEGKGGLRVVEVRRRNWGTTWWVELRRAEDEGEGEGEEKPSSKSSWW
ncbi:hypothetical protein VE02_02790 [Pseudogymnoascus sp. 03VT05]|nr:hypothetical protein VE02_02790 [Pseudogymnoascus sp. 03VT05]